MKIKTIKEHEASTKLDDITNTVKIADEKGNEFVYKANFYFPEINSDFNISSHVKLEKYTEKVVISNKLFRKKEPGTVQKIIWRVDLSDYKRNLIKKGKILCNNEQILYQQDIVHKLMSRRNIKPSSEVLKEVFGPMEKELMEAYKRIKEF